MSELDPPVEYEFFDPFQESKVDIFDNGGRQTTRRLTKFERAKILGARADEISRGAPIMVEANGETNSLKLAMMEEEQGKLVMKIRRFFPPGDRFEDWSIDEMISESQFAAK